MSDEYGDAYGEAFVDGDGFDEDDAFCHSNFRFHLISNKINRLDSNGNRLFAGDYDGSENEYSMNDTENGPDSSGSKVFGKRHWERSDPKAVVKQEKVNSLQFKQPIQCINLAVICVLQPDDYIAPLVDTGKDTPVEPEREKRADELDDLFSGLNPEDEVEL